MATVRALVFSKLDNRKLLFEIGVQIWGRPNAVAAMVALTEDEDVVADVETETRAREMELELAAAVQVRVGDRISSRPT